jgi:hypothetical protein
MLLTSGLEAGVVVPPGVAIGLRGLPVGRGDDEGEGRGEGKTGEEVVSTGLLGIEVYVGRGEVWGFAQPQAASKTAVPVIKKKTIIRTAACFHLTFGPLLKPLLPILTNPVLPPSRSISR